jgi:L-iditol 2-dehydrogenase
VLVVSGLGPVGLLSVIFAKPMGATVVGIDPSAGRREIAGKLGADVTLDPTAGPVGDQLREHFPDGADKLTETSGATPAHQVIGDLLKPLGTAAIVGLGNPEFKMPMRHLAMRELTVFGSSIYPNVQFDEMSEFIKRHNVNLESIVSHQFLLEDGPEAYQIAADANSGKVVFRFD